MKISLIIPSFNPDEKLIEVVSSMSEAGFSDIICINDGSSPQTLQYFEKIVSFSGVKVLTHSVNRGKGAALKTAFEYMLFNREGNAAVTVDGDNQHKAQDVQKIVAALEQNPQSLVLGVRTFDGADVPVRSSFGNRLTSRLFRVLFGLCITDTQTGLRGIPFCYMRNLCDLEGERFEYETNMLIASKKMAMPITEVPIQTIYIEENKSSHFRPVADSLKIFGLMAKFFAASLLSTAVDLLGYKVVFGLMTTAFSLSHRVLTATVAARVVSSMVNFLLNKKATFRSSEPTGKALLRYYLLAAVIMLLSYSGVYLIASALGHSVWIKVCVDSVLFLASFKLQKSWVFKE